MKLFTQVNQKVTVTYKVIRKLYTCTLGKGRVFSPEMLFFAVDFFLVNITKINMRV